MRYLLRATNERGDPVDVILDVCWRCGVPVSTFHVTMEQHVDVAHPLEGDEGSGRHSPL